MCSNYIIMIINQTWLKYNAFLFVDDKYRPFLMSYEKSRNDYINAVIIPVSLYEDYKISCEL